MTVGTTLFTFSNGRFWKPTTTKQMSEDKKVAEQQAHFEANKAYHNAITKVLRKVEEIMEAIAEVHNKPYKTVGTDVL